MLIRHLGRVDYEATAARMRAFTEARDGATGDELWVVEHAPVFTQGVAGKPEHLLLNPADIPVVRTERGGQITYHGPGQVVVYLLFDLRRAGYGVREMVIRIENAVIATLARYGVAAYGKRDAPGVYVQSASAGGEAKIASLGLKVRSGCTYHGVALNVAMDLTPFGYINPCGYAGLRVTDLTREHGAVDPAAVAAQFAEALQRALSAPPVAAPHTA